MFFCLFLCCHCRTMPWMPNFTFCRRQKHKTMTLFLFSWTSIQSFRIQPPENFAIIWRFEWDVISAIRFKTALTYLLSNVFVAVAVIVFYNSPFFERVRGREVKVTSRHFMKFDWSVIFSSRSKYGPDVTNWWWMTSMSNRWVIAG